MKIKDLLLVNFAEDIKDVIDLQDNNENHIQEEIENYIITQKIAEHTSNFIHLYKGNIKETGVWLSGFYGSGKSYFGKMLGYLLNNQTINGTPFRERYIHRLGGLINQSLFENEIRGLDAYDTKVVMFDCAKHNKGQNPFAWVVFENFLTSLNFLDDIYGYLEYDLFLTNRYETFLQAIHKASGKDWHEVRRSQFDRTSLIKKALTDSLLSVEDFDELKTQLRQRKENFDAQSLKEELSRFIEKYPDKRLVFIIDEVSEAVELKKIDLLELEAISEVFFSLPYGKVWIIAVAQEKLDDVITNSRITRMELNKVTDRFRTKYHLSSEEVGTVIQKRLLIKDPSTIIDIEQFYAQNSGRITDVTNVSDHFPAKTETLNEFKTNYPFHKYHFQLLPDFLFSTYQKAKTGGTERGMITATHSVLKAIINRPVFEFATGDNLVDGAKKSIEGELERKFLQADSVLNKKGSLIKGARLLKIIYLLDESKKVNITPENITRLYLNDLNKYYETLEPIREALQTLTDANLLIEKNGTYKIATDLEKNLVDEMRKKTIEFHTKKRRFIEFVKSNPLISSISDISFEGTSYRFTIKSDQGDEIQGTADKHLVLQLAAHYNVDKTKHAQFIERIKNETRGQTNTATFVPNLDDFEEIDRLIEEITRYLEIEQERQHETDAKVREVLKDFAVNRLSRTESLKQILEKSYKTGTLIYYYEEHKLNESDFSRIVKDIQTRILKNTYTERLSKQLSDELSKSILKETSPAQMHYYFDGPEFKFFDSDGNFIGENLKIVQKIVPQISTTFIDGAELERRFAEPPYGYSYGTVNVTLAVLLRIGRLAVKYNNITSYNYREKDVQDVFKNSHTFRKASFKSISIVLSAQQKKEIVDALKGLRANKTLDKEFQYSTPDIELVGLIAELTDHYIGKIESGRKLIPEFDVFFNDLEDHIKTLRYFCIKITDANCKTIAEEFIKEKKNFKNSIEYFENIIRFSESSLPKVRDFLKFAQNIMKELDKLGDKYTENPIRKLNTEFNLKFSDSVLRNYEEIEKLYQQIKDEYYTLMKNEHQVMVTEHKNLKHNAQLLQADAVKASEKLNETIISQMKSTIDYADKHICDHLAIEQEVDCENCNFALYEIISINEMISVRKKAIDQARSQIQYSDKSSSKTKRVPVKLEHKEYPVGQFKSWLGETGQIVAELNDNDIIIFE